ncbi:alkylhydroperoxidase [Bacillus sp. FJAT-18019]|nr:alkylhydroperoxidase [Bacillus sp. FJAT-18019]
MQLAPETSASFLAFEKDVYQTHTHIPLRIKELIALAVAHVTGCPYCIDVHVKKFKQLGGTREEILEAVLVATATRAGAILSHATHALLAYETITPSKESKDVNPSHDPECFC